MSYLDRYARQCEIFEGRSPTMYRDSAGRVTVGVGNMLSGAIDALKLPFRVQSSGDLAGEPAVRADYARVLAMPIGHPAHYYSEYEALALAEKDIDALLDARLSMFDLALTQAFDGFASFPDPAKLGLMDMAYNLGTGRLVSTYHHFVSSVRSRDWGTCARQCDRNAAMTAFAARNTWTRQQFLAAASA